MEAGSLEAETEFELEVEEQAWFPAVLEVLLLPRF